MSSVSSFKYDPEKPLTAQEAVSRVSTYLKRELDNSYNEKVRHVAGFCFAGLVTLGIIGLGVTSIVLHKYSPIMMRAGIGFCIFSLIPLIPTLVLLNKSLCKDIRHDHENRLNHIIADPETDPNAAYLAFMSAENHYKAGFYHFIMDVLSGKKKIDDQFLKNLDLTKFYPKGPAVNGIVKAIIQSRILRNANESLYQKALDHFAESVTSVDYASAKNEVHRFLNLETLELDYTKSASFDFNYPFLKRESITSIKIKANDDLSDLISKLKMFPKLERFALEMDSLKDEQLPHICKALLELEKIDFIDLKFKNLGYSQRLKLAAEFKKFREYPIHLVSSDIKFDRVVFQKLITR